MSYLVFSSEGYGGYWGSGESEQEATANWQAHGGSGQRVVMLVDDAYEELHVDHLGNPRGRIKEEFAGLDEWPVFDRKAWLVGPRGGSRRLVVVDGQEVAA